MTALFSDLRNFTPLSERLAPAELIEELNAYLTAMSRIVDRHGGVIDKFVGDALMALYGAPLEMPDQVARACETALDMRAALEELNRSRFSKRGSPSASGLAFTPAWSWRATSAHLSATTTR